MQTRSDAGKKPLYTAVIFAIILIASVVHICVADVSSLDELWNYNFSRMITMGMLPYRDYNMVPTPLFTMIMSLPLFISRSLFAFRIACSLFIAALFWLFYRILTPKNKNPLFALPFVLICILLTDYVSYNDLFLLLVLAVCFLLERSVLSKYPMAIGALCTASVFARQTSGCLLLVITFIIIIFFYKEKVRSALFFAAGAILPGLAFLIYFICTSSLNAFWDYCLFSLTGFGKNNTHFFPGSIVLLLLLGIELAAGIFLTIRKKDKLNIICLLLGIPVLSIMVPIIDYSHVHFAVIYFLIPVFRLLPDSFSNKIRNSIIIFLSALIFICISGFGFSRIIGTTASSDIAEFKNVPVRADLLNDYTKIADITAKYRSEGYSVTMFSSSAVIVSIISGDANPPYDTFNEGNFPGSIESHMVYVEQACSGNNKIIIIASDYDEEGWQNPSGVLEYVRSNCEITGSYGRFLIFRTP